MAVSFTKNSRACKPWFFIAYQNVVFRHQLLERFHDVVEQIVHHIVVVLPGPVGQMTGAEHDDCVVAAGFEVAAMRQDSFVRLDHLQMQIIEYFLKNLLGQALNLLSYRFPVFSRQAA